jgi:hypothetical protein
MTGSRQAQRRDGGGAAWRRRYVGLRLAAGDVGGIEVPEGATGAPNLRAGDRVTGAYGVLADHAAASLRPFLP